MVVMDDVSLRTEVEFLALLRGDVDLLDQYAVTTDLFTEEEHQSLFSAIETLHERKEKVTKTSIQMVLKENKLQVKKETIKILFNTKTASTAKLTYEILLNFWRMREAKKIVTSFSSELDMLKPVDIKTLLTKTSEQLERVAQNEEIEGDSMDELMKLLAFKDDTVGILTGYVGIDNTFNGFKSGNVGIICADTGVGKTTLAINMAYNMAMRGKSVGFVSLEMTKQEMLDKVIARHCAHSVKEVERRNLPREALDKVKELKGLPLHIFELTERTVENIMSTLLSIKRKIDADIIFIDYIGLIAKRAKEALHEGYAEIIMLIKHAAQRMQIPVICLTQTTRGSKEKGYTAESVQYSQAISACAHQIGVLRYTDEYEHGGHIREMSYKIVKNRSGRNFMDIPLSFDTSTQHIFEPETVISTAEPVDIPGKW